MVPYGRLMRLSDLAHPTDDLAIYIHNPWRLLLSSFYQPEGMGAWMRGTFGEIQLETGLPEGTEIDIHLQIAAAPWAKQVELEIAVDARPIDFQNGYDPEADGWPLDGAQRFRRFDLVELRFAGGRRLAVRVGPYGLCVLHFLVGDDYEMASHDPRQFVLGVVEIGFVRRDDLAGRVALLESNFVRPLAPATA